MTRREWTPEELAALTQPVGYGSKMESFEGREWEWLDAHQPDLELRCETVRSAVVGHAWAAPDRQVWFRSGTWQGPVAERLTPTGTVTVECPVHGLASIPGEFMTHEAHSTRRKIAVLCTDPAPRYPLRS